MGFRGLSPPSHQFNSRTGQEKWGKASGFQPFVTLHQLIGKQVTLPQPPTCQVALRQWSEEQKLSFQPQH